MENIFNAINDIVKHQDVEVVFPIHLNPKVREIAYGVFKDNLKFIYRPLEPFTNLMSKVHSSYRFRWISRRSSYFW